MAKKGTYHVHDPEGQPVPQDTSYKSFLCALLVFIAFCALIIAFSSVNWFKKGEKEPLLQNTDAEILDKERLRQGKEQPDISSTTRRPHKTQTTPKVGKEVVEDYPEYTNVIPPKQDKEKPRVEETPEVATTEEERRGPTKSSTVSEKDDDDEEGAPKNVTEKGTVTTTTEVVSEKKDKVNEGKEEPRNVTEKVPVTTTTEVVSEKKEKVGEGKEESRNVTGKVAITATTEVVSDKKEKVNENKEEPHNVTEKATVTTTTEVVSKKKENVGDGKEEPRASQETTESFKYSSESSSKIAFAENVTQATKTHTPSIDFNVSVEATTVKENRTLESVEDKYDDTFESTERQIDTVPARTEISVIFEESSENLTVVTTTVRSKIDRLGVGVEKYDLTTEVTSEAIGETTTEEVGTTIRSLDVTTPQVEDAAEIVSTTITGTRNETTTVINREGTTTKEKNVDKTTEVQQEVLVSATTTEGETLSTTTTKQEVLDGTTTEQEVPLTTTAAKLTISSQQSKTTPENVEETSSEVDGEVSPDEDDYSNVLFKKTTASTTTTSKTTAALTTTSKTTRATLVSAAAEATSTVTGKSTSVTTAKPTSTSPETTSTVSSTSTSTATTAKAATGLSTTSTTITPTTSTTNRPPAPAKRKSTAQSAAQTRLKNKFKMAVSRMLATMDHTTDSCEDFYWYSCGAATEDSSPESRKDGAFRERLKKEMDSPTKMVFTERMGLFYRTCVEHEMLFDYETRLEQVKDAVKGFVTDNPFKEDFTKLFAEMVLTGSMPAMEVDVDVDKDTKEYVFKLSPPYRTLTRNEMERWSALYSTDSDCAKRLSLARFDSPYLNLNEIYKDYSDCTRDFQHYLISFNLTKRAFDFLSTKNDGLEFHVENEVLDYIKNVETTTVRDSFVTKTYQEQTLAELQGKFDDVDWKMFFNIISGQSLVDSSKIFVYEMDTLYKTFRSLDAVMITESYRNFLAIYTNDVYQNSVIPKATNSRERYCSKLADYLFSDVSTYLYMKDLSHEQIAKATEMANRTFETLRAGFLSRVEDSTDIDDEDKTKISSRIEKLSPHFMAKSDECISELPLKQRYQKIDLGTSYISQLIAMRKYKSRRRFALVGQQFKDDDMFCHLVGPQDLKPKSFYSSSKIAIPYEFLLQWSMDYPGYFLMAKIGTNIAIEIGKLFNKVGLSNIVGDLTILDPLYTAQGEEFFIVQQKNLSMTVSEGKNIQSVGDNAGFRLSHRLYNKIPSNYTTLPWIDFTDEKIFFIAAAQEFCEDVSSVSYMLRLYEGETLPNYWRVNNMIINTKDFKKTFECKSGCNMSPSGANHLAFPDITEEEDYS